MAGPLIRIDLFFNWSFAEKTIYVNADGKAEITYNYDRTKYVVTYDSNG